MELTIEQQVQASLSAARDKARKEAEETIGLRLAEKEQTIASMAAKIEDLKKKAEQGSQQLQGEVQELQLESLLRASFRWIPSSRCQRVSLAAMPSIASMAPLDRLVRSCGSPSHQELGRWLAPQAA